jgi:hypothetical protein
LQRQRVRDAVHACRVHVRQAGVRGRHCHRRPLCPVPPSLGLICFLPHPAQEKQSKLWHVNRCGHLSPAGACRLAGWWWQQRRPASWSQLCRRPSGTTTPQSFRACPAGASSVAANGMPLGPGSDTYAGEEPRMARRAGTAAAAAASGGAGRVGRGVTQTRGIFLQIIAIPVLRPRGSPESAGCPSVGRLLFRPHGSGPARNAALEEDGLAMARRRQGGGGGDVLERELAGAEVRLVPVVNTACSRPPPGSSRVHAELRAEGACDCRGHCKFTTRKLSGCR